MKKLFIVGCGDIGRRVASLAHLEYSKIMALIRTPEKGALLEESGIETIIGNLDDPASLAALPTAGADICYFAPPPGGGIMDTRMQNFCSAIPHGEEPAKFLYLSTSGVYGDCGSRAVTEETPPNPVTARARRRLHAESTLTEWGKVRGVPVVILRVTGIYGPGRLPLTHLMNGVPLLNESEAPVTNRIHADDLAAVCIAALVKGNGGDIFNVSDGEHGTMTHYFNAVADLLGIPRPPQVGRDEAAMVMPPLLYSYFCESRHIDNRKMIDNLGITLRYPTLAEGLSSCKPENLQPPGTGRQE
jgi:nucleoside-diphosphate-sugar epimerase